MLKKTIFLSYLLVQAALCQAQNEQTAKPDLIDPTLNEIQNVFLNNQAEALLNEANKAFLKYPPAWPEPEARKSALLLLDGVLHDVYAHHRPPVQDFFKTRMTSAIEEIEQAEISDGARIWKLYNHAFVVRTNSVTIGFDLASGISSRVKEFSIPDEEMSRLAKQCDVLFVSHYHGDHAEESVAQLFIDQGKPVVAPARVWSKKAIYDQIVHLDREPHTVQELSIQNGQQNLKVIVYPGHQGSEIENNVYLVFTPEGLSFSQMGDQSNSDDFQWIDEVSAKHQVDVLIPNCWTTDISRVANGFNPALIITGHENEMGHTIDHREPYWLTYQRREGSDRFGGSKYVGYNTPLILMTWGESYHYERMNFPKTAGAFTHQDLPVIPYPSMLETHEGFFNLNSNTVITCGEDLGLRAKQLKDYLEPATGFNIKTGIPDVHSNRINLRLNENLEDLGVEGYTLAVSREEIIIEAAHSQGIFYAFQTLLQLLPNEIFNNAKVENMEWNIPGCSIQDVPQFEWRGLMIDYSRTFWDKRTTKKYLDAMALYKLNKLHMHLTDDQGWRIEIKKYPKLTEVASKFDPSFNEPGEREGYFSQSDMKELISYAKERNIELIPEIEMPGHSSEVFSVYPELSCKGDTMKIHPFTLGPGIHQEIFCAGNDETFVFLNNVLSEIIELFPSKYIHIGGDEAPKDHWKECPKCQQRIKDENLKDEHELQSWFIKQIESYLSAYNKTLIGWDEIVEGGLSRTATVMYWRGWMEEVPGMVLNQGNNIIMSPTSHCYFDYTYETTPTDKVYSYKPVHVDFNEEHEEQILGVQANFWSHLSRTEPEMDGQIFPRILALAEVGWSDDSNKNWHEFTQRLDHHFRTLDILGIDYYKNQ